MTRFALIGLAFDAAADRLHRWRAPFAWALATSAARAQAVIDAISWARAQGAHVVVFSGYTQEGSVAAPGSAPIVSQLRAAGLVGVFELVQRRASKASTVRAKKGTGVRAKKGTGVDRAYFVYDAATNLLSAPMPQEFAKCAEATRPAVRSFVPHLAPGGSRRHHLRGVDSAILVCGEDNIAYQPRGGSVTGRYGVLGGPPACSVVLNPRHTVSVRHEHRARVRFFSSGHPDRFAGAHANYGPREARAAHLVFLARGGNDVIHHGGRDSLVHRDIGFYGVLFVVP